VKKRFNPFLGGFDFAPEQSTQVSSEKLIKSYIAAEAVSAIKLVYSFSPTQVKLAKNNGTEDESKVIGITLNAAGVGDAVNVQMFGQLDDGSLSFSANELLFLGTSGSITSVANTTGFFCSIGYGMGTGSIFLSIEKLIVL
jgi:hypothetical protein